MKSSNHLIKQGDLAIILSQQEQDFITKSKYNSFTLASLSFTDSFKLVDITPNPKRKKEFLNIRWNHISEFCFGDGFVLTHKNS